MTAFSLRRLVLHAERTFKTLTTLSEFTASWQAFSFKAPSQNPLQNTNPVNPLSGLYLEPQMHVFRGATPADLQGDEYGGGSVSCDVLRVAMHGIKHLKLFKKHEKYQMADRRHSRNRHSSFSQVLAPRT